MLLLICSSNLKVKCIVTVGRVETLITFGSYTDETGQMKESLIFFFYLWRFTA